MVAFTAELPRRLLSILGLLVRPISSWLVPSRPFFSVTVLSSDLSYEEKDQTLVLLGP